MTFKYKLLLLCLFIGISGASAQQRRNRDSLLRVVKSLPNGRVKAHRYYQFIRNNWRSGHAFYLDELDTCIELSKSLHLDSLTGDCYRLMGTIDRVLSKPAESETAYLTSLKYAEKANDAYGQAENHLALGTLFCVKLDFKRALPHLNRSRMIAEKNKDLMELRNIFSQFGVYYGMQHRHDSAKYYQLKSIEASRNSGDPDYYASELINYAITLKNEKKYELSLKTYAEAERIADSIHAELLLAAIYINRSWVYYEQGKFQEAIASSSKGLKLSGKLNELDFDIDGLNVLRKSYAANGNYAEAYKTFERYLEVKDTLFNRDKLAQLNDLNTQYEVNLKDANIAEQKQNILRQRYVAIGISMALLIIIVLIGINYRNSRINNRNLKVLNSEIESQKSELEKLNNVKSVLFTVISHDLRSPLNTLKVFINRMNQGKVDVNRLPEYFAELSKDINATSGLIDNLLDWSQSQMQGYSTNIQQVDISEIVMSEIEKLQYQISEKKLSVINAIPAGAKAKADAGLLSIIFRNLLANAIKYTPSGQGIHIQFQDSKLSVTDSGAGIDAATLNELKLANLKVSKRGTNNEKGTGMGLMICQNFASLMQCQIEMESSPGNGSKMSVVFPATA